MERRRLTLSLEPGKFLRLHRPAAGTVLRVPWVLRVLRVLVVICHSQWPEEQRTTVDCVRAGQI